MVRSSNELCLWRLSQFIIIFMKSTKFSLLGGESDRNSYHNTNLYQDSRNRVYHEEVPYSTLKEQDQLPQKKWIEMKKIDSQLNQTVNSYTNLQTQFNKPPQNNPYQSKTIQPPYHQTQVQPKINSIASSGKICKQKVPIKSCVNPPKSQYGSQVTYFQKSPPPPQSMIYPTISPLYQSTVSHSALQLRQSYIQAHPQNDPFVPPVHAICANCECKQKIPGDTDQYYCGRCKQINNIEPKFGFFICGTCQSKVCYPFKTSDHIQCNQCFSINVVPQFAKGRQDYKRVRLEEINESVILLPKELREEEEKEERNSDIEEFDRKKSFIQQMEELG